MILKILFSWFALSFFVGGLYALLNYLDYKRTEVRKASLNKGDIRVSIRAEDPLSEKVSKVLSDLALLDSSNSKEAPKKEPHE